MLSSHLSTHSEIIVSGVCNNVNEIDKILELLKIDIVIVISSNGKFISGCRAKIGNKPTLLICPENVYVNVVKVKSPIGHNFQFLSLNSKLENLQEKLRNLSKTILDPTDLNYNTFISKREKEILQLILRGKKNKEIAEDLFLSIKTIENHRNNILKKTRSKSMIALLNELYKMGFLS